MGGRQQSSREGERGRVQLLGRKCPDSCIGSERSVVDEKWFAPDARSCQVMASCLLRMPGCRCALPGKPAATRSVVHARSAWPKPPGWRRTANGFGKSGAVGMNMTKPGGMRTTASAQLTLLLRKPTPCWWRRYALGNLLLKLLLVDQLLLLLLGMARKRSLPSPRTRLLCR